MGLAGVVAVVVLGLIGPAGAATEPPSQDQPATTWLQPGTGPLDGLGTFFYVAPPLTPVANQGSPLAYEYTVRFRMEDGALGHMALGYKDGRKVAAFVITPPNGTAIVEYDWKFGQIYYLLTYRLSPTQWGAWVYDFSAASWSLIAVQTVLETTGRMLPESTTSVDYDASLVPTPGADISTCAFYPRVDALWYPPTGWRGSVTTTATLQANGGFNGTCDSTTQTANGWQWYTLGQAAA